MKSIEKYYKEEITTNKEYEIALNGYLHDLGIIDTVHLVDYESLDELESHVNELFISKLNTMWKYYYDFCIERLNNNRGECK